MTTTEVRDVRYAPAVPVPDPADMPLDLVGVEFPGCTARRVRREELGCYEGRLEFWDAQIATRRRGAPTRYCNASGRHSAPRKARDAALEEGRRETQIRTVYALLSRRGIDASSASVERVLASANHATETIVSAALACTGFEDFARRLGVP